MSTPLTTEQIERGGKACYRVWTITHAKPPAWESLPDWQREKWRVTFLAGIQEIAMPGLLLPGQLSDGMTLRERLLQKRLRERAAS